MSDTAIPTGHIEEMGILNLLAAKTADDFKGITKISEIGVILVPEHLSMELMKIPMEEVGMVAPIPAGENVNLQVGQIKMSGDSFAAGDSDRILVVVGQLFITSPVRSVGYRGISIIGQVFAPRGSEDALSAKILHINGQVFYLPENPRLIMSDDSIGGQFLELLPEPASLVVMGKLTIEQDVTLELMKSKILEIVLFGEMIVPKSLLPLTQVLAKEKFGELKSYD